MTDLFKDKAKDWDARPIPTQISEGVSSALLERVDLHPQMRVMDFGAGTGLLSSHLAPKVEQIYAVDISSSMLEKLAAKPELQGKVQIACQDILEAPLQAKVDLIVSAMALHHIQDTDRLLKVFADHLEAGGKIALADLDKEDGSFHPEDIEGVFHQGFERGALETLLRESGFQEIVFTTATEVSKEDRGYPIFLVTATKA